MLRRKVNHTTTAITQSTYIHKTKLKWNLLFRKQKTNFSFFDSLIYYTIECIGCY